MPEEMAGEKRMFLNEDFVKAIEWYKQSIAGIEKERPVSYTHLDVYKRQPLIALCI